MIFVLFFEDNDNHADMRTKYMTEHLSFLLKNTSGILAAGPLKDTDKGDSAGGLWLVEADTLTDVKALIEQDPFWPTGLRKSVRILEWTRVFAAGEVLI
ncbi:MAG: hypothetical protein GY763_10595 [Gammaproteobacteria bacterium]|nr:hypothetical protein [Gammaproteobacteria bacterium]